MSGNQHGSYEYRVALTVEDREALLAARRDQNIGLKALAKQIGVPHQTVSAWLLGYRRPTGRQLINLVRHLCAGERVPHESASLDADVVGGLLQQDRSSIERRAVGLREADGKDLAAQLPTVPRQAGRHSETAESERETMAAHPPSYSAVL